MKLATRMFAVALTMVPLLAVAQLGADEKIVTNVPFEFVVANKIIPAGQCTIQLAGSGSMTLAIRNRDARMGLFSESSTATTKKPAERYALVFHKYGDRAFLWGMKLEGSRTMYRLPESKAEAELQARNVPATEEILLASLQ